MTKLPTPANDEREWGPNDYWAQCLCGSSFFTILWRAGLSYVLCAQCEQDHTMTTIWGKTDAK